MLNVVSYKREPSHVAEETQSVNRSVETNTNSEGRSARISTISSQLRNLLKDDYRSGLKELKDLLKTAEVELKNNKLNINEVNINEIKELYLKIQKYIVGYDNLLHPKMKTSEGNCPSLPQISLKEIHPFLIDKNESLSIIENQLNGLTTFDHCNLMSVNYLIGEILNTLKKEKIDINCLESRYVSIKKISNYFTPFKWRFDSNEQINHVFNFLRDLNIHLSFALETIKEHKKKDGNPH